MKHDLLKGQLPTEQKQTWNSLNIIEFVLFT